MKHFLYQAGKVTLLCLLLLSLLMTAIACDSEGGDNTDDGGKSGDASVMREHFNNNEYILYINVFDKEANANSFVGSKWEKTGTFAVIHDCYNNCDRYYVWGYADQTKCCDWQWEFVPSDPASLPEPGSTVTVTGTFNGDERALDGYWMTDAQVKLISAYNGTEEDMDLTVLSATLARVQIINIRNFTDQFDGKTMRVNGRVYDPQTLQHPYYDGAWYLPLSGSLTLPATGTNVTLIGTFHAAGGTLQVDSLT